MLVSSYTNVYTENVFSKSTLRYCIKFLTMVRNVFIFYITEFHAKTSYYIRKLLNNNAQLQQCIK